MQKFLVLLFLAVAFVFNTKTDLQSQERPPAWAYPVNPADFSYRPMTAFYAMSPTAQRV
jgi:hypothetical protein